MATQTGRNGGLQRRVQGERSDLNQNPLDLAFLGPPYPLFTRGCEHDAMDSRSIPIVTDDHAFIVDAVKIGVPRSGRIQLLPGLGLSVPDKGPGAIIASGWDREHSATLDHTSGQRSAVPGWGSSEGDSSKCPQTLRMRHTTFSKPFIVTDRGDMPNANKCYAYFYVAGSFHPAQITERVGINPTKSSLEGDGRRSSSRQPCKLGLYDSRWLFGKASLYQARLARRSAPDRHLFSERMRFRGVC